MIELSAKLLVKYSYRNMDPGDRVLGFDSRLQLLIVL